MKFYLGTNEDGHRTLYPWEKDIPKGVKAPEIDIPTDKNGLMAAIQELLTEADDLKYSLDFTREADLPHNRAADIEEEVARPLVDALGIDPYRPSWTIEQLNAMFSKRPEGVQDICYAISKLKPDALAYVAFQVAGQMTKPITINIPKE